MLETVDFQESGDIATISILRKTINGRQIKELEKLCDRLEDQSSAKMVVFRGYSQGIDFADFDPDEPLDIHGFNKWEKLVQRIERLQKVTLAAVDGPNAGGGWQLALACDLRVCTPDSTFSLPEVKHGFLPGMATYRLAKYIGVGRARRLVLTGAALSASEAADLGLVERVDADLDAAIAWAHGSVSPINLVAATLARRLMLESFSTQFEDAIGNFLAAQHRAISQSEFLATLRKQRS